MVCGLFLVGLTVGLWGGTFSWDTESPRHLYNIQ